MSEESEVCLGVSCDQASLSLLQGIFESYEGIGIVRTVDSERGFVQVITTLSMEGLCRRVLTSLIEEGLIRKVKL
jgi:Domain of unknown function (DUF4911)